jgi:glycine/D-amino acid oxidase-like deaminating enzyme
MCRLLRSTDAVAHSPAQVGTRSRLIRVSTSEGRVWCTASDDRYTPARPASHVWNVSVDVLRRIARERVPTIASASPNQIAKPTGLAHLKRSLRERIGVSAKLDSGFPRVGVTPRHRHIPNFSWPSASVSIVLGV